MSPQTPEVFRETAPDLGNALSSGLLGTLWRRKALVILGVIVGLIGGSIYYVQKAPTYQSSAQIMVMKRRAESMPVAGGTAVGDARVAYIEDYVATQEALIKSHEVLRRASKRLESQTLQQPVPGGDYIPLIASGLKVERSKDVTSAASSNVLNISFRGGSPEDAAVILNAVIEGYRDALSGAVSNVTEDTLRQIVKGRDETEKQLAESLKEYNKANEERRNASPEAILDLKARINKRVLELSDLENTQFKLETRFKQIQKDLADGCDRNTLLAHLQLLDRTRLNRPDNFEQPRTPDEALFTLRLQEEELLQRVGEDHPDVVALRKRRDLIKEHLSKSLRPMSDIADKVDLLDLYIQDLQREIVTNAQEQKLVRKKLDDDRTIASKLEEYIFKEDQLAKRCDMLSKRLAQLDERKQNIDLTRDAPLFDARVITPAAVGSKVSPVLFTTLAIAGFLGLILGCGLAYLAEVTDKSFRSIDDVRIRLGVPVIGQIPPITPHESNEVREHPLDPMLVVEHNPRSVQAEAYRGVRTSLYFSTRGKGHQVIQVTSPNPGDGKSTLISNLACSIALSGKRVILLDADFRKPRIHQIFGVPPEFPGLASVISGEVELHAAIYPTDIPNLFVIPCGPRPANPADLLTSAIFQDILDQIKDDYDFVLIDTPPVLAVSDPSVVAPRVDGVILTLRMTPQARAAAERAKDRLVQLGANVLGVVVNDVEQDSKEGYGYGYGYSYGYLGYAYGDDESEVPPVKRSR